VAPVDSASADSPLSFPCEIAVKVLGPNIPEFRAAARDIVSRHYMGFRDAAVSEQLSRNDAYVSLTFVVNAQNREEIDALYRELTASDEILMVL
jgi:putative lipoic acid-binding regulatory protein